METDDIAALVHKIECHRAMLRAKINFLGTLCGFLDHCARETSQDDIRMSEVEHQRRMLRQQLETLILNLELVAHEVFIAWIELAKELLLRQVDEALAQTDEFGQDVGGLIPPHATDVDDLTIPLATFRCRVDMRKWNVVLGLKRRDDLPFSMN